MHPLFAKVLSQDTSTSVKDETAVLDYIVFCDKLDQYFEHMLIDEERIYVLTKYVTTKGF